MRSTVDGWPACLDRDLAADARAAAVDAMEAAYGAADLERFAAWVHETDTAMAAELVRRGYALAETTLAMGMELRNVRVPRRRSARGPRPGPSTSRSRTCRPAS